MPCVCQQTFLETSMAYVYDSLWLGLRKTVVCIVSQPGICVAFERLATTQNMLPPPVVSYCPYHVAASCRDTRQICWQTGPVAFRLLVSSDMLSDVW